MSMSPKDTCAMCGTIVRENETFIRCGVCGRPLCRKCEKTQATCGLWTEGEEENVFEELNNLDEENPCTTQRGVAL